MAAEVSRRKIWIAALGAVLLLAALATLNAFNTQLPRRRNVSGNLWGSSSR